MEQSGDCEILSKIRKGRGRIEYIENKDIYIINIHVNTHGRIHTQHICTHTHAPTHARGHTHMHAYTYTHIQTCMRTPWPTINIRPHIMHFRRLAFSYTEVIY